MGDATKRASRTVGLVIGFAALAAIPALGLGAFAAADTGPRGTSSDSESPAIPTSTGRRHMLTDAQKQCLSDHGVTLPQPPRPSERSQFSHDQRSALQAAAQACGIRVGPHRAPLTNAQKQCLSDHGVTLPQPPRPGERSQFTQEQRGALRAAAEACGIEFRDPGPGAEQPRTA